MKKSTALLIAAGLFIYTALVILFTLNLSTPRKSEFNQSKANSTPLRSEFNQSKANSTPLRSEFYQSKDGHDFYFKIWIENAGDIPYDDFVWKITKIQSPDGRSFSNSYPTSKTLLLKGMYLNSHAWGGVNPYGSDCHPGDRFIIEIPRFDSLTIDSPDTTKGLKVLPY